MTISLPNGQITNPANLKNCLPIGMPIIVNDTKRPKKAYKMAAINPPKTNHITFPINFM